MTKIGFEKHDNDNYIYFKLYTASSPIYLLLYVDDILLHVRVNMKLIN